MSDDASVILRPRVGRSARRERAVTSPFRWLPSSAVPGAELPASVDAHLRARADRLDAMQRQSRVEGAGYMLGAVPSRNARGSL
jgi:hypothetical protein